MILTRTDRATGEVRRIDPERSDDDRREFDRAVKLLGANYHLPVDAVVETLRGQTLQTVGAFYRIEDE